MPLTIIRNDITRVHADAIVNTANPHPCYGSGTDQAIYEAAGAQQLLEERKKIGDISRGDAVATPAFALPAKYIIHTVGPAWQGGNVGEFDVLSSCYKKSLQLAVDLHCSSVAFPLIATGVYGFPKDKALSIAVHEISTFLLENDITVILVVFSKEAFVLSGKIFEDVKELMDDFECRERLEKEYKHSVHCNRRIVYETECCDMMLGAAPVDALSLPEMQPLAPRVVLVGSTASSKLGELLDKKTETFQQYLFRLIDARQLKDADVYRRANMLRQTFAKIRANVDYFPKKKTAIALAISLQLDMPETMTLLGKAGWTISDSNKFDIIIRYCIENKVYNIHDVNTLLEEYCGEKEQLGA